jgi:hypothetical protein
LSQKIVIILMIIIATSRHGCILHLYFPVLAKLENKKDKRIRGPGASIADSSVGIR